MKITQRFSKDNTSVYGFHFSDCHVLIVDDDPDIREILQTIVASEGHHCQVATDGEMALDLIENDEPDVVISDIDMPKMDGIELLKRVKAKCSSDVIIMTGFSPNISYSEFLAMGASDFVQKPIMPSEMSTRLNRVLRERCYRTEAHSAHQKLLMAHAALQSSYHDTIHRLVLAAEYKDEDTGDHIVRIGRFCMLLAQVLGLEEKEVENIGYAAPMHDIGKIGIPDKILLKPGKLTAEEFDTMKKHTIIGSNILANSKSDVIRCAQQIAISHHERWDGNGYPQGQKGEKIPITGRIVAIADTFDALSSRRPYKTAYPIDLSLEIMQKEKGLQFDPHLFDLFMNNIDTIISIKKEVAGRVQEQTGEVILSERDLNPG